MTDSVRCFFAVAIPNPVRERIEQLIETLRVRPNGDRVKWVPGENLHLTLRFVGEAATIALPDLMTSVRSELEDMQRFVCHLKDVRTFPNNQNPKVVAASVDGEKHLSDLAAAVERGVSAAGFAAQANGFRAHLTIGRLRGHGYPSLHDDFDLNGCSVQVDEVVLFESDLSAANPIYTRIEAAPIGGSRDRDEMTQQG